MEHADFISLRKKVLELDPGLPFQKKYPGHIVFGLGWMCFVAAVITVNLTYDLSLGLKLLSSLALGIAFSSLAFFNHELLHGTMIKSTFWMHVLAYPGFFILALSPELWRTWHNQLHHFNTNQLGGMDPDLAGDWQRLKDLGIRKRTVDILPGGNNFLAAIFMVIAFNLQCLNVTWVRSKERPKIYASMNRTLVNIESLAYYAIWIALAVILPFEQFLYLFLIPLFFTNSVIINFVGVPHNMRPLSKENRPLLTTISLKVPRIVNWLAMNFCYHCEHHIFPEANHKFLPRVHTVLVKEYSDQYYFVPYFKALAALYTSPRAYFDEDHLFNPHTGEKTNMHQMARERFR
ncbi:MAG: fatty acid desaturase [Bdellovibrionales bacterium]|nr:fatty acid desaturase [Bdellovibrionales bacterium]